MFEPNPGLSHLDVSRLMPAVHAPVPKPSSQSGDYRPYSPSFEIQKIIQAAEEAEKIALIKKEPILTNYHKDILYGILLGDGSLASENSGRTFRLRLVQSKNHKDYLDHLVFQFENFGKTAVKLNPANSTYYWNSLQSGSFRFYGHQFYNQISNNKFEKKVPDNVHQWLTARAATYWFLDDGSAKDKKTTTAIRFCTDSFSKSDVERLMQGLEENFDIKVSRYENRTNQHRIYCRAPSISSFWDQVVPILQNEIAPSAPNILRKLPNKIYTQVMTSSNLDLD